MVKIWQRQKGMTLAGQGAKILLFTLPFLLAAIVVQNYWPQVAALPFRWIFLPLLGVFWLIPGLALWGTAMVQLLSGWSQGRLVTSGAYGIVRNPIYSSAIFFFLPAVTLLSQTWVYLPVAVALYLGVQLFIRKEEAQLKQAFGADYEVYLHKVDRLIPFRKP